MGPLVRAPLSRAARHSHSRSAAAQVELVEGALVCPETGRKFPVVKGIPNMLLNEDEC